MFNEWIMTNFSCLKIKCEHTMAHHEMVHKTEKKIDKMGLFSFSCICLKVQLCAAFHCCARHCADKISQLVLVYNFGKYSNLFWCNRTTSCIKIESITKYNCWMFVLSTNNGALNFYLIVIIDSKNSFFWMLFLLVFTC